MFFARNNKRVYSVHLITILPKKNYFKYQEKGHYLNIRAQKWLKSVKSLFGLTVKILRPSQTIQNYMERIAFDLSFHMPYSFLTAQVFTPFKIYAEKISMQFLTIFGPF